MADDITEFEEIDPLELHLVGTPANKFAALMAKSSAEKGTGKMSKKKALRKLLKESGLDPQHPVAPNPSITGVNIGGRSSTLSNHTSATSFVRDVLAGFDARAQKAKDEVAQAEAGGNAMAKERARQGFRAALRQRLLMKMVIRESAQADRSSPVLGLGSPIFKEGSTYSIGDDDGLGYTTKNGVAQ